MTMPVFPTIDVSNGFAAPRHLLANWWSDAARMFDERGDLAGAAEARRHAAHFQKQVDDSANGGS